MKRFAITTAFLIPLFLFMACHSGSGTDESTADTITKTRRDIDTLKMMKEDTCIPDNKVDNSKPEK